MGITLPQGNWINLHNLTRETTAEDIAAVIAARTGVEIRPELISVVTFESDRGQPDWTAATISFSKAHLFEFMKWAMSEDKINGRAFDWHLPDKKTAPGNRR